MIINLDDPIVIDFGLVGEDEARNIYFDINPWINEYGSGTVSIHNLRPNETTAYPITNKTLANGIVTWTLTDTETSYAGVGSCELKYVVSGVTVKSRIWETRVNHSLTSGQTVPSAIEQWIDTLEEKAEDITDAALHQAYIGTNNHWYTWNSTTQAFEDSNVDAHGDDGDPAEVTEVKYGQSSSGTTAPSSWSTTIPTVPGGHYLWTRLTFNDESISYIVARQGIDGAGSGDMQAQYYDPDDEVLDAGGIPDYVAEQIASLSGMRFEEVTTLPSEPTANTIYLIDKGAAATTNNKYDKYFYVSNVESEYTGFEFISGVTKAYVDNAISTAIGTAMGGSY